ncbi:BLUF domain-containing protein [uncultured Hymenobacter sp.]|uniref:BLUF domain-containing protein n=1 Tax=uncultured Hymenobacter sp. TaxID=170016 RepID=UPI0035CAC972
MHHLIYSSSATYLFSDTELQALLAKARSRNEQYNVTGVLLYHEGQFMQLLEGEAEAVHSLYSIIAQDSRHTGILKLADKPISARSFPEWAMAFRPVETEAFAQVTGYQQPANLNLAPQGLSAADVMLLSLMHKYMLSPEE